MHWILSSNRPAGRAAGKKTVAWLSLFFLKSKIKFRFCSEIPRLPRFSAKCSTVSSPTSPTNFPFLPIALRLFDMLVLPAGLGTEDPAGLCLSVSHCMRLQTARILPLAWVVGHFHPASPRAQADLRYCSGDLCNSPQAGSRTHYPDPRTGLKDQAAWGGAVKPWRAPNRLFPQRQSMLQA